jgi:hypothetical protein
VGWSQYAGTVLRVDPHRNAVAEVKPAGGVPTALTAAGDRLWVSLKPRVQHRGGTLVMLHQSPFSIDPGVESGASPFQSVGLASDGLVMFNHIAGPKGLEFVPDLAIRVPPPTDGARRTPSAYAPGFAIQMAVWCNPRTFGRGSSVSFALRSLERDLLSGSLLRQLQTRFASLVHTYPATDTEWLQFNTTRPPFDDVRVRQALNLAIDRRAIVRIWGGAALATPTCQLIPRGVAGFRGYCPYTRHPPSDGTWRAPDVEFPRSCRMRPRQHTA